MTSKRGTVNFEAGGVSHKARLSTNAMIRFQDETGRSVLEAFAAMDGKSADIKALRDILWASLEGDHTREDVGDIIDDLGFVDAGGIIGELGRLAFPPDEPVEAGAPGNAKAGKKPR
jgi:hypothetical protein